MKIIRIRQTFIVCLLYLGLLHSLNAYALEENTLSYRNSQIINHVESGKNLFQNSYGFWMEMCISAGLGFLLCSAIQARKKHLLQKQMNERQSYDERYKIALIKAGFKVFEFDKTQGIVMQSNEKWGCCGFDELNGEPEIYIKRGIIHPEDAEDFKRMFDEVKCKSTCISCIIRLKENMDYVWNRIMLISLSSEDVVIGIVKDISEEKEMVFNYQQEEKYRISIKKLYPYCLEMNISKNYFQSKSELVLLNCFIEKGDNMEELLSNFAATQVYPEDQDIFRELFQRNKLIENYFNHRTQFDVEFRLKAQGNQYTWWNCHLLLYSDERGDICGIVFFKDIDEQKQNTLMLQHYAERDLFTGLYNKATTQTQITKVLTQNNDKESIHGIMVLDIDDFKNINDTMGHIAGDIVLKKIANDMKDTFRKSDIIGRTGGDEFMVCMKDILDIGNVTYKAEELLKKIRSYELYMENGKKVEISVSIGIALYPQQGNTFQELYQKADRALYHSKRCGKNQYFIYDSLLE